MFNTEHKIDKRFKKVIIWGHLLDTNTFSYVNAGFYKAFSYLGYETLWLNNNSTGDYLIFHTKNIKLK